MIIKNCPSYVSGSKGCASAKTTSADCEKNTNCIMKQLANALIEHIEAKEILYADRVLQILEVEQ